MHILIIINDPPYGSERPYQALRLADALLKVEEDLDLSIYLMSDAVMCAKKNQKTPNGYYNIERMLKGVCRKGTTMICRTCAEARGLEETDIIPGIRKTTLGELATLTLEADKVLVF